MRSIDWLNKLYVIDWGGTEVCQTYIRTDTRGRRSRRARRAVRAARHHELDVAQRLLFHLDLPPVRLATYFELRLLHERFAPRQVVGVDILLAHGRE